MGKSSGFVSQQNPSERQRATKGRRTNPSDQLSAWTSTGLSTPTTRAGRTASIYGIAVPGFFDWVEKGAGIGLI
jgi:hypothetical protein